MKKLFPAFLAFIFIACSSNTPAPTLKAFPPTITTTPVVESPTALPTFAVVETLTPLPLNVFPTPELLPTQITPTAQPMRTPLPEILPKFPLDGYVILFTKDSDLYFQDGNNSPIKLDHVIEVDYGSYKISDDNQKIAIGVAYSINTDGTQKQTTTFPNGWRDNYLWGVNFGGMDFVPSTHQLIFSSHFCTNNNSSCVSSVFLADTDTGEFRKLADLGFSGSRNHENFKVSPNGKMVAITTTNYVDIIDMEGKVIRHDVLPFKPNTPDLLFPSVFWLPDSSGLIVALPNTLFDSVAYNYVPAYTIGATRSIAMLRFKYHLTHRLWRLMIYGIGFKFPLMENGSFMAVLAVVQKSTLEILKMDRLKYLVHLFRLVFPGVQTVNILSSQVLAVHLLQLTRQFFYQLEILGNGLTVTISLGLLLKKTSQR